MNMIRWSGQTQCKQSNVIQGVRQTLHGDRATMLAHKGAFTALER